MSLLERLRARLPAATPRGDGVQPSDFVELQQLPIRYGHAVDMIGRARNRGDDLLLAEGEAILEDTFTEDFVFEDVSGDPVNVPGAGGWAEFVADALGSFAGTQHLIAPPLILIDEAPVMRAGARVGGRARLRSYVQATHLRAADGERPADTSDAKPTARRGTNMVVQGTYRDE